VRICLFTGSEGISRGCESYAAAVLVDSTSYYIMLDYNRRILRCPIGTSNPNIFRYDDDGGLEDAHGVLFAQMLANGLVRFVCGVDDRTGPGWSYRYTCSTSGIRTIQPDPKSDAIYVDITSAGPDSAATTYRGFVDARCDPGCAPRSVSFHILGADEETPTWTSAVDFSPDGLSFWLSDLDARRVAIRINQNLEVLDIRR
jgi:hypothetical protein